ncbi:hypothetical protein OIU34_04660 [Pararhizobium sp. BT-229]|uniref:DUF4405 domain-containing protein n=1 Tax=Pararhizobium sp. BT-229 TaxID=2986923 RepID=UPI0021F74046|nr:DUF4405 domain-containing protein [Pararhizobium sp. BT-229]MCV9961185.1 hypothetical protein [Pararhizobium sp. BT-229]
MTPSLPVRLGMNFLAGGLLIVALAYDWLGNVAHEIVGTIMFALLLAHNTFNRRWYARASKGGRNLQGWVNIVVIVSLLSTMLALLGTSLMISRSIFSFLPLNGGYAARLIHGLAAYWALIIVSAHVGLRWSMIMGVMRGWFRINDRSNVRTAVLRIMAAAISVYGIHSSFVIGIRSRLMAEITMNVWIFSQPSLWFFLQTASIMVLYACSAHYAMKLARVLTWPEARDGRLPDAR